MYRFKKGGKYDGDYIEDLKHGRGVFSYPDGSSYDGEWREELAGSEGKCSTSPRWEVKT